MRSSSASPRQPVTDKKLYRFDEYTSKTGKTAFSMRISIKDMAAYYAEHPSQSGWYERDWDSSYLGGKKGSKYVPSCIKNANDALFVMDSWQLPPELKARATRASRYLAQVFEEVAKITIVHDLTSGKLDRRKLSEIARHTASGTFDAEQIRPYRRTIPTPAKTPTLAIVASVGNAEMWEDSDYIPRVIELTLGILWACEAAGLNAYAAGTEGHCDLSGRKYAEAVGARMLAEPNMTISPRTYAVAMHRDLWRHGKMTAQCADPDSNKTLMALRGQPANSSSIGASFPCYDGGNGVNWARKMLDADVIIAIGNIKDAKDADIKLGNKFELDAACKSIAEQAKKLTK